MVGQDMQSLQSSLQRQELPGNPPLGLLLCVLLAAALLTLTGCGLSGSAVALPGGDALIGNVRGGNQPVSGSHIQLYAAGTSGTGSTAQPLLSNAVESDDNGNFLIPAGFRCPSQSSQVFVVADGGNPGLSSGTDNKALALTAMLGSCSKLSAANIIIVDEVSTIGSIWPLAAYMKSPTDLGSAANDSGFLSAVSSVPEFINLAQGSSPGTPTPTSYFAQNSKLYSLADALSNCVDSPSGSAGDGSPCGLLFSMATSAGAAPPTDTITAAMQIAQNPDNNVTGIYSLVRPNTPFQPTLTTAPPDWRLNLTYAVATPSISLPTGTYTGTQEVTISDSTAGSTIHYTTDGTVPTSSSLSYSGAISLAATTTIRAIAVLNGSQSAVASSTLSITVENASPVRLAFVQQPSNSLAQATISPAIQVAVEDVSGKPVLTATNPVTIALVGGTGLAGILTAVPQNGIATFSNLSVSTAGTGLTLSATSPRLSPANSTSFTISAPGIGTASSPINLAFLQQPTNALTQATISPAVQVAIQDAGGNTLTTATNPVTIALVGGTGLGGTLTVTPQNGIATFSNLTVGTAGSGYTLSATSPGLNSATSTSFTISTLGTASSPLKLAFSQQPTNALTQATIAPAVRVAVEDASGNTVTTATNPITIALVGGTGLGGTLTVTPQNGIAIFGDLTVGTAGSGYTLSATSPDLTPTTSTSFTISAPGIASSPVKLAFAQQPSNALTQAAISPAVQVAVEDANGNTVTSATNPITVALVGGTGLGGTLTVTPQNGIATFSNLKVGTAGSGYTLSATSPDLTSTTSTSFTINAPGAASSPVKLAFTQQPSNASIQAAISPAVRVAIEDGNGNTVTTANNPVTLALTSGTGLAGTLTVTPQNGVATFSNLTVGSAGSYTLSATSTSLTSATSTSFTISAPSTASSPVKLAFTQQPSNALTQAAITPAIQVAIEDANGNTVTTANNPVTLALGSGAGLGGTLTVTPQNGVATFSNLTVSSAGAYTLSATSASLTSATSTSFTISAPSTASSPVKLAFAQQPSSALTQAVITPAIQVAVEDANGNTVTTANNPVTLALTSGTGLGGTLTATPQNGVATFSNLTVSSAGAYTLSATSASLTSAISASFTISAPTSATNGSTIQESTPLSITTTPGGTFQITYNWQAMPVAGAYTVFVNFVDSAGTVQFQDNVQPPTSISQWTGAVSYTHTVTVPSTAGNGTYTIVAGLQSTSGNLSITAGTGVTALGSGKYQIGTLTLAPTCSITSFGAVGDGVTDNATAIQNTFNYAATNHCVALIPAGIFAYSGDVTATGIAVAGTGAASILAPLSVSDEALILSGSGGSVSNLVLVSKATVRLTTPQSGMIWVNNATNYYIENVLINDSSSIGIMSYNSSGGYILNNTVENTLADSITQIDGSYNIVISGNHVLNAGDDGISNNSYVGEPLVHNITVQGNTVANSIWGRGLEVSGGNDITLAGNYINNTDGYADVYISSETEWNTQGVNNVTVTGNTLLNGGPNQGSITIYNSQGTTYAITGVTVIGNQLVNPGFVALQLTGNGSESGIALENNTDYSTGQFSSNADTSATYTQTGNQVLAPSTYLAPLVSGSAGVGCNFAGC